MPEADKDEEIYQAKKWKWQLIITKLDNGFLLEGEDLYEAFVEDEEDWDPQTREANVGMAMLWGIIDHFGLRGSKYDKLRVRAIVEPGHCYEDPDAPEGEEDEEPPIDHSNEK